MLMQSFSERYQMSKKSADGGISFPLIGAFYLRKACFS